MKLKAILVKSRFSRKKGIIYKRLGKSVDNNDYAINIVKYIN